jgi:carbon monoxide dehydrogenase subunit G
MELIETSVVDRRLVIKSTGSYSASSGGLIKIVMPAIKALNSSGATNTTIKNLKTDQFSAELSGASKLTFEVTEPLSASESEAAVDQLQVKVSGASKFDGALLPTNHVKAQASGASRIILQVQQSIEAEASGASAIVYRGDAKLTSQKTSGASKIAHE